MSKKIRLKIIGRNRSGKSTAAQLIKDALQGMGIQCTITNEDDTAPTTETIYFNKLDSLKRAGLEVEVEMVTCNRAGIV